jgi:uncharacterized protein YbjQ (UPF0145 family)
MLHEVQSSIFLHSLTKECKSMIVTTGNDIAGYKVTEYLGVVRGIIVRSTGIARGLVGGLKSIAGGNIREYATVCEGARQDAYNLMLRHAEEMGADAVLAMRYDATEFMQGSTEVLAYGTAVKISAANV